MKMFELNAVTKRIIRVFTLYNTNNKVNDKLAENAINIKPWKKILIKKVN